ncbi:vacuolar protein sorting-associated protein VTA1 homolog [Acanthaster planci]|uniref:Vacuolar protein sorting-associated protein VTA1 homolog n=1 Tax=Acanthaster planci TaxID=133434 RepID=A0A8B7XQ36_ACAPL|nr:vacuolar protein sorting-associated protein VTA1 homolog [Acanthaster planci]XP_022082111.1 vacuolar protein sorting-associated protein VTA1 homolog [Acanthaster planci]
MANSGELEIPPKLKAVRPYLLLARDHDKRDPVVAFFCRHYAMETALALDKQDKSPDNKIFLSGLMDRLEKSKEDLRSDEILSNELASQAHVETCASKIFVYADNEDRAGRFHKAMLKSFYKSGLLFDVMQTFGELSEDLQKTRKYAKWKVTYITGCQKRGETPHAGPLDEEGEEGAMAPGNISFPVPPAGSSGASSFPPPAARQPPPGPSTQQPDPAYPPVNQNLIPPGMHAPPTTPEQPGMYQGGIPGPQPTPPSIDGQTSNKGYPKLSTDDFTKAQKYCKYAGSSLQYDDIPTAVDYLEKALRLLKTGKE